jgi:hypothetical protein
MASLKHHSLHLIHSGISRFWVQPIEDRLIPGLEKKNGLIEKGLIRLASWSANAGRVIVNEMRLVNYLYWKWLLG